MQWNVTGRRKSVVESFFYGNAHKVFALNK